MTEQMTEQINGLKIHCFYCWRCVKDYGKSSLLLNFAKDSKQAKQTKIENVKKIIKGMKPYNTLLKIARENGRNDEFNEGVAWHYWRSKPMGSFLDVDFSHNKEILGLLAQKGFNINIVKAVAESLVMPGKILKVENDGFLVEYSPLSLAGRKLILSGKMGKRIINPFQITAKVDDIVSFHFSSAAERLDKKDARALITATRIAVRKFNAENK